VKKLLKIDNYYWNNESRDKRDLSAAMEAGFDVAVVAKGEDGDKMRLGETEGFKVYFCGTKPLPKLPVQINRVLAGLQWAWYIAHTDADVLNGHDLTALFIGYLATKMMPKKRRPKLVYDAHEFELARNTDGKRGKVAAWVVQHMEAFLMKRADLSVMVNDSIAEETARIHGLETKPLVIRNICNNWELDQQKIAERRAQLLQALNLPKDTFLIMYHGAIMPGRGVEHLLETVKLNSKIALVILGNGAKTYVSGIKEQIQSSGVSDRVLLHEAVPHEELWEYVGAADVGMVTVQNVCRSYYYMLPNKFFENIQSLTPVICSDFPEVSRLVNEYGIGLMCDPSDIQDINAQIERMRTDKEFYESCKRNLLKAKEELCWEREKEKLVSAYKQIMQDLSR
jgi:glycosyltransferase involved in cell wall biosynthesis